MADYHLVVVNDFGDFSRGDIITDPAVISDLLAAHHDHSFVRIPAPAPDAHTEG